MRYGELDVIAPAALGGDSRFSEAEAFGAAAWLMMHSSAHRNAPLQLLGSLVLPAIRHRQFVIASDNGQPVFYLAWAWLDAEAESRYLRLPPQSMLASDWTSGDRLWLLDWIAPFGHTRALRALIGRRLFPHWCASALYHRGAEKGLRIRRYHGVAVSAQEARLWFAQHPCKVPAREAR